MSPVCLSRRNGRSPLPRERTLADFMEPRFDCRRMAPGWSVPSIPSRLQCVRGCTITITRPPKIAWGRLSVLQLSRGYTAADNDPHRQQHRRQAEASMEPRLYSRGNRPPCRPAGEWPRAAVPRARRAVGASRYPTRDAREANYNVVKELAAASVPRIPVRDSRARDVAIH